MNETPIDRQAKALSDLLDAKGACGLNAWELLEMFRFLINNGILQWRTGYGPRS